MATVIRLTRRGRMHAPFYRIGVFDRQTRRDGAAIENLGYYNPLAKGEVVALELNEERINYWVSVGAEVSETVSSFLDKKGISYKKTDKTRARNKKRAEKRAAAEKKTGKKHGKTKKKELAKAAK